jgi:hypothetical protein
VNNHPSTFALSFDPKSVPNIPFILYEIAVLFTAIAVFYTAHPSEVNSSFQIFVSDIEYVLIRMSDDKKSQDLVAGIPGYRTDQGYYKSGIIRRIPRNQRRRW